jgi:PmbA protein
MSVRAKRKAGPPGDLEAALKRLPDGCRGDLRVVRSTWTTIRFSNGKIHQPHREHSTHVSLRVADGRRLATATGADASAIGLDALATSACALARIAPVEKKFPGFPRGGGRAPGPTAFSPATARITPEAATDLAQEILDAAFGDAPGSRIAGVLNVGTEQLEVVNSSGLDRSGEMSMAQASVLVERPELDPPVSGWSEGAHWDVRRLRAGAIGSEAARRMATRPPTAVEPGEYPVVLRGPAVAELLGFLGHLGFAGSGEVEGWTCLAHRRGKKVAPPSVTLVDDARSRETIPAAIDYEGAWTNRTPLIEKGIARDVVTDLLTAGRLGKKPTGHAPFPEAPWGDYGALPNHLLLEAGDANEDELVRETRKGILVTRFHYVRTVDPGRGIITGMTRDGTYVIENGEIARPARNLRFTESVLTAIAGISLIGKDRRIYASERGGGAVTAPSIATRSFRFTSATLF